MSTDMLGFKVKLAIKVDPNLEEIAEKLDISASEHGVVTIRGTVDSEETASAVEAAALTVPDATGVVNELKIG